MPAGSGGQIALFSVGSLYTEVTSALLSTAQWTNFVSESVEHNLAEIQEGSITGYKARPPSYKGTDSGAGDIQLEPNPNALGMFLRAVFGQSSGTVLTAAGSWGAADGNSQHSPPGYPAGRAVVHHRFVPRQTSYEDRSFLPPHGLMLYKDVGSAFVHMGAVFPSIDLNIQAGQLAKATVSMMSREVTRFSRISSVAALRNPGGRPWTWDQTSIQVGSAGGLAAYDKFQSLAIKFETPIEGVLLLDGTKRYGEFQTNGFQMVDVSGTMSFRDQAEYDRFIEYETQFMRVTLTNVNTAQLRLGNPSSAWFYQLAIDVPALKFTSWSTPIQGPNRLTTTFKANGEFDVNSLYQIEARLINTTSVYA